MMYCEFFSDHFGAVPSSFTGNEAIFGYTQPGFMPTRHSVAGHGMNNFFNDHLTARLDNWCESKNPQFGNGDSQRIFGWLLLALSCKV